MFIRDQTNCLQTVKIMVLAVGDDEDDATDQHLLSLSGFCFLNQRLDLLILFLLK